MEQIYFLVFSENKMRFFVGRNYPLPLLESFVMVESAGHIVFSLFVLKDGCVSQARVFPRDFFFELGLRKVSLLFSWCHSDIFYILPLFQKSLS